MKHLIIALLLLGSMLNAQVTGLSGWDIFIDPGHSRTENMGVNGYSEAEANLQTALHLKNLLRTQTDIDTVWTSRSTDNDYVTLSDRSILANNRHARWFHSIHSNCCGTSNDVLLLWGMYSDGREKVPNGGKAMSDIMVNIMSNTMRIPKNRNGSIGDCQFYGCSGSGPYLSVNRNTTMPSELSEQGFHSNPTQNNLQMSSNYGRLVAYSMFWTILDFHSIARPYPGLLTGIIRNSESSLPINGATIQVNGESYTTDTYASLFNKHTTNPDKLQNGFYIFENLPDQAHEVIVTADGFYPDTLHIADMSDNFVTFLDVTLTANTPPYVTTSSPALGDSIVPAWKALKFRFNRPMNTASVENAFSISPSHSGVFDWTIDTKTLTFTPDDTLAFVAQYTVEIAGTAVDVFNHALDGNGDGVGGDAWTIQFTTGPADLDPPVIVESYPYNGETGIPLKPVFTIVYDEQILPLSFSSDLFVVSRYASGQIINTYAEIEDVGVHSVVSIYLQEYLNPEDSYQLRVLPGLTDLWDHTVAYAKYFNFKTGNVHYEATSIDDFDGDFMSNWWNPKTGTSGQTTGVIDSSTNYWKNTSTVMQTTGSAQSMQLDYAWDPDVSNWMIRLYLSGGAPQNVSFDDSYKLQAFVYGDGQGNNIRFAVDDAISSEVSPWYTVDWYGWRLVSWDLALDSTGIWLNTDRILNGALRMDSFQFEHVADAGMSGTYYIDDLHLAVRSPVTSDPGQQVKPTKIALLPNYPNPFNPWTNILFTLPERTDVKVDIYNLKGELVDHVISGSLDAGQHTTRWNASQVSSGIYLVRLESNNVSITQKITVLK